MSRGPGDVAELRPNPGPCLRNPVFLWTCNLCTLRSRQNWEALTLQRGRVGSAPHSFRNSGLTGRRGGRCFFATWCLSVSEPRLCQGARGCQEGGGVFSKPLKFSTPRPAPQAPTHVPRSPHGEPHLWMPRTHRAQAAGGGSQGEGACPGLARESELGPEGTLGSAPQLQGGGGALPWRGVCSCAPARTAGSGLGVVPPQGLGERQVGRTEPPTLAEPLKPWTSLPPHVGQGEGVGHLSQGLPRPASSPAGRRVASGCL